MKASGKEVEILREGGQRLAKILNDISIRAVPGTSTSEFNETALRLVAEYDDEAAFLGYKPRGASRPYPSAVCVSINDEVVHGISSESPAVLKDGDILTLDMGLKHKGLVTDMALTVSVGSLDKEATKLIEAAREALRMAIATAIDGATTGDIGAVVESTAERHGFSVPRELGGHGVGQKVHEDPFIPNFGEPGSGDMIEKDMVLAIEPIIIEGLGEIFLAKDGYTYKTADGSRSAQFEHTVLVTEGAAEILTKL